MRKNRVAWSVVAAIGVLGSRLAFAQQPPTLAPSLPSEDPDPIEDLQAQLDEMRQRLKQKEEEQQRAVSPLSVNGYVDFGFFAPLGNDGVGWVRDVGNMKLPEHQNFSWTFLGDILGTAINTRGEVADLGESPGVSRFDSVDSNGAPGFILNETNLQLGYQLSERALLRTSVNFVPRNPRQDFALGDFVDVDLAEMEYVLTEDGNTSIFAGKTLPVFGIEYKERKSNQRFGITPSLMQRYTSGPQLGLKFRSKLLSDWLILAGAVSNNSSTTEQFHFYREIDSNSGKTLSGRVAVSVPVGSMISALAGDKLELGLSGEWGPQDWDLDNKGAMTFAGLDLQYLGPNLNIKAQVMHGEAPGEAASRVWTLNLRNSGYVEVTWQFLPFLGVILRAENRDAIVSLGTERIYVTDVARFTGGLRAVFNQHVVLKAEYLHNRELGDLGQFKNDIVTSSLVLIY